MLFGGVALVGSPVILRIFLGYAAHIFVAVGLGEHRSRRLAMERTRYEIESVAVIVTIVFVL